MADAASKEAITDMADCDWVFIKGQQPEPDNNDDAVSTLSDCETVGNDCVRIDNPKDTRYPGRLYCNPDDRAVGPIPELRSALYVLKDGLTACVQNLTEFNNGNPEEEALGMSIPIVRIQRRQLEVVQRLLTNISHDWEQSAASGGMTFDEYAELDAVHVNELGITMDDFAQAIRERTFGRDSSWIPTCEDWGTGLHCLRMILPAVDQINILLKMEDMDFGGLTVEHEAESPSGSEGGQSDEAEDAAIDFGIGTVEYIECAHACTA